MSTELFCFKVTGKRIDCSKFIIFLILISSLGRYYFGFNSYLLLLFVLTLVAITVLCNIRMKNQEVYVPLWVLFFILLYSTVSSHSSLSGVYAAVVMLVNYILGYWLYRQDKISVLSCARLVLIVFYILFFVTLLVYGWNAKVINNMYVDGSQNIVSATVIFFQVFYSAAYFRVAKKAPQITPFVTFFICILCIGRGGVFIGALILLASITYFIWNRKLIYKVLFIISIPVVYVIIIYSVDFFYDVILVGTKVDQGVESIRTEINKVYYEKIDLYVFMFGLDLSTIPLINQFDDNPHNSFIYGHARFGILYVFLILLMISNIILGFINKSPVVFYLLLILFLFFRIMVDKLSLPGVFDAIVFYLYFLSVSSNNLLENKAPF